MDIVTLINAPCLTFVLLGMGFAVEVIPAPGAHKLALICTAEVALTIVRLGHCLHTGADPFWALAFLGVWSLLAVRAGYRSNLQWY